MKNKPEENEMTPFVLPGRRAAAAHIKLLRLALVCAGHSPCDDIGTEWNQSMPEDSLSPVEAARRLGVDMWASPSQVHGRYSTLQRRYPIEQFMDHHTKWRPAAELLGKARERLNWFWKTGLVPRMGIEDFSTQQALDSLTQFVDHVQTCDVSQSSADSFLEFVFNALHQDINNKTHHTD